MTRLFPLAALAAVVTAGCSNRPPVVPVAGTVLVDGRPAGGAAVVFHPVGDGRPAVATTGPDGTFRLSTFAPLDGAQPGDYRVTVTWPRPTARTAKPGRPPAADPDDLDSESPAAGGDPPDVLGERYARPEASGLTAAVPTVGPVDLPPFRLSSR